MLKQILLTIAILLSLSCRAGAPLSCRAGVPLSCRAGAPLSFRAGAPLSCRAGVPLSCRAGAPLSCRAADSLPGPGEVVPQTMIEKIGIDRWFSVTEIPDAVFASMQGKSFKSDCTVPRSDLRYLRVLHKDAEGRSIVGEMVVNKAIAADVLEILRKLYEAGYPIERMRLIDLYDADDETSMRANNSSSFNFRFVSHTTKVSKHGYGMAVDINPLYNPYHKYLKDGTEVVEPATGRPYLDRKNAFAYKITGDDLCCRLFKEKGFEWGGDWKSCKDYQHFEK